MNARNTMHGPWRGRRAGGFPMRLALPVAAMGAARLATRRQRRHGPSPLRFLLPVAALGMARMALHGGRHRHGPGPFGGPPPFGPGEMKRMFHFGPFGRGPRARRGDVRAGILALLAEEPRNGYGIIQELGQRSGGAWRPSPGSIYPALQQLEDEGLVRAEEIDGKRVFRLTDDGRAYVEARKEELAAPWNAMSGGAEHPMMEVGGLLQQVALAAMQVVHTGTPAQLAEARQILINTRRSLYRVLAEDEPAEGSEPGAVGRA